MEFGKDLQKTCSKPGRKPAQTQLKTSSKPGRKTGFMQVLSRIEVMEFGHYCFYSSLSPTRRTCQSVALSYKIVFMWPLATDYTI